MLHFDYFISLLEEYALLVAVCVPVFAIAGLDLFLALKGERGTGLLPTPMRFPVAKSERRVQSVLVAADAATDQDAANDEHGEWQEAA